MSVILNSYIGPKFEETTSAQCREQLNEFERQASMKINFYHDIQSLMKSLSDPNYLVDFIGVDLEYLHRIKGNSMFDIIRTLDGISKIGGRKTEIVGVVGHDTDPGLIRESLQVPELKALIMRMGGPWTFEMSLNDILRFRSGDYTVSQQIKQLIKTPKKKTQSLQPSIVLTPRQTQVLDLVTTRGASNKIIARTLKISESTVKLHMSAILKKYGCRNRTQLAVFTQQQKTLDTTTV